MKKQRLFYLDLVRAISVIIIIIYHFNTSIYKHKVRGFNIVFNNYANGDLGDIGVALFFIISGSALMYTYENNLSLKSYFYKRFMSLFPMFWIAYCIAFIYLFCINGYIKHSVPKWTFILTILGMDGYLYSIIPNFYILGEWFLGCIILLYFCFPILRKFANGKTKTSFFCICIFYIILVQSYNFSMSINRNFLVRIFDFAIGIYFVKCIKQVRLTQFILAFVSSVFILLIPININKMYKISLIGLFLFLVIVYLSEFIKFEKIKNVCKAISKYSYAVFLVHHVIIEQIIMKFDNKLINVYIAICLFVIICIMIIIISNLLYRISNKMMEYCLRQFATR